MAVRWLCALRFSRNSIPCVGGGYWERGVRNECLGDDGGFGGWW